MLHEFQRIAAARQRQHRRQGKINARLEAAETLQACSVTAAGISLLQVASARLGYSARSQHRILRVARTIADLAGRDAVTETDVAEALGLRWED